MTVERKSREFLSADRIAVAQAVRNVLKSNPRYRHTVEQTQDSHFTTNAKPYWWALGTDMTITLREANGGTIISITTVSQSYVYGDIFGLYNLLINDFLNELKWDIWQ